MRVYIDKDNVMSLNSSGIKTMDCTFKLTTKAEMYDTYTTLLTPSCYSENPSINIVIPNIANLLTHFIQVCILPEVLLYPLHC